MEAQDTNSCNGIISGAWDLDLARFSLSIYHPTTCFVGNKIQVLAREHANPAVKAQIHQLRGLSDSRLARFELILRLPLAFVDLIVLEKRLGRPRATEFVRAVDPWCYPGETTQAGVVLKKLVQSVLEKSRDAVKYFHLFSEESKSAFLPSPILIKERQVLIRKTQGKRGSSAPVAPPAPTAPVDLGVLPTGHLLPASVLQPPAPPPVPPPPPPVPPALPSVALRRPRRPRRRRRHPLLPGSAFKWAPSFVSSRKRPRASPQRMPPASCSRRS